MDKCPSYAVQRSSWVRVKTSFIAWVKEPLAFQPSRISFCLVFRGSRWRVREAAGPRAGRDWTECPRVMERVVVLKPNRDGHDVGGPAAAGWRRGGDGRHTNARTRHSSRSSHSRRATRDDRWLPIQTGALLSASLRLRPNLDGLLRRRWDCSAPTGKTGRRGGTRGF